MVLAAMVLLVCCMCGHGHGEHQGRAEQHGNAFSQFFHSFLLIICSMERCGDQITVTRSVATAVQVMMMALITAPVW